MSELDRNQIIKALRCFSSPPNSCNCIDCYFETDGLCEQNCSTDLADVCLRLIKELTETIESLRKRIQHLCASEFITSFDEVDTKTKAYKKDIAEADRIFKEYQRLEAKHDPFPFCSISGCEAVREGCHKTCPLGYENSVRIKAVKDMQEGIKATLMEIYGELPHTNYFFKAVDLTAGKLLEGIYDDS